MVEKYTLQKTRRQKETVRQTATERNLKESWLQHKRVDEGTVIRETIRITETNIRKETGKGILVKSFKVDNVFRGGHLGRMATWPFRSTKNELWYLD